MTRYADDPAALVWGPGEVPASQAFADVYFSREGGLAESRAVFLEGCGLPRAWAGRDHFCVAELGFGTGRNVAALLALWGRERPAGARLSIFSVEAFPMSRQDAARALASWPEVADEAGLLTARWPAAARGFHRIDLPELCATLDVAIMDVGDALEAWSGKADAWFLDGFAPAKNPQMWRAEIMALVREKSSPGARLATYTVAGSVRQAVGAQGFSVERAAGFGSKKGRLEAQLPGKAPTAPRPERVAIIGGGIAGAALAHAFAADGIAATVFDLGEGASRGPAALVAPRLDAGLGVAAQLFAQAMRRARALYEAVPGAIVGECAVQLAMREGDERRFETIAGSEVFAREEVGLLTAQMVRARVGEVGARTALVLERSVTVTPQTILSAWVPAPVGAKVAAIERLASRWRLHGETGEVLMEAQVVCVAAGMGSADLTAGLPLVPVRGQASFAAGVEARVAVLYGGYSLPASGGVMIGATHAREDDGSDVRDEDERANLAALKRVLPSQAARVEAAPRRAWAAVRATTRDYLPIVGAAPDAPGGLFVLTGLGSRGFCLAPLLAEHVAALALGRPSPLTCQAARLVAPARFAERAARRGRLAAVK